MSIYDFKVKKKDGSDLDLGSLKGKVVIIVNTATGCGFTPQYEGLENLYKKYHDKGLEILDFPCNQFGHQAPGTDDEIHQFCTAKYDTSFDQLAKIEVNGENEEPVYAFLKQQIENDEIDGLKDKATMFAIKKISATCKEPGDIIRNFTKFLVDKDGNVVERYSPIFDPMNMEKTILEII